MIDAYLDELRRLVVPPGQEVDMTSDMIYFEVGPLEFTVWKDSTEVHALGESDVPIKAPGYADSTIKAIGMVIASSPHLEETIICDLSPAVRRAVVMALFTLAFEADKEALTARANHLRELGRQQRAMINNVAYKVTPDE